MGVAQGELAAISQLLLQRRFADAHARLAAMPPPRAPQWEHLRLQIEASHALGLHDEVIAFAGPYVLAKPKDAEVQRRLGDALLGKTSEPAKEGLRVAAFAEQAIQCYEAARAVNPKDLSALEGQVKALVYLRRPKAAVQLAKDAFGAVSEDPEAYRVLAHAHEAAGEISAAAAALTTLQQLVGDDGWPSVQKGLLYERVGQREPAIRAFTDALVAGKLSTTEIDVAAERVWTLAAGKGDFVTAYRMLDAWSKAHEYEGLAWWWRGYLHEAQGKIEEAGGYYQRALDFSSGKLGLAALHLGHLSHKAGDPASAAAYYGQALANGAKPRPGTAGALESLLALGEAEFAAGKIDAALALVERYGLGSVPAERRLRELAGRLMVAKADARPTAELTKAKADARKAVAHFEAALAPADPAAFPPAAAARIHARIADARLRFFSELDPAVKSAEAALELEATDPLALEVLGNVALRRKRFAVARSCFERILAKDPGNERAKAGLAAAEGGPGAAGR